MMTVNTNRRRAFRPAWSGLKPLLHGAALLLAAGSAAAADAPAAAGMDSLLGPALRMLASLAAVLALVIGLAWVAKKLRTAGHLKSGLIEVVSGVSLGAREKVVLLRVGQEQVLVGVSPSGMRALHVIREPGPAAFSSYMEPKP
jgi:flagellar protein FliO/FliZ